MGIVATLVTLVIYETGYPSECGLEYKKEIKKFLTFNEPGVDFNVTIPPSSSECLIRILVIGGGGSADDSGGGSGYIKYHSQKLPKYKETKISLMVGDQNQTSVVTVGNKTFTAAAGQQGSSPSVGGDGYSGGGAYSIELKGGYGSNGGANGGDGEDGLIIAIPFNEGGHGTGEDIKTYPMEQFILSPGAGGKIYEAGVFYYGGGGGGVLVNGNGPQYDSVHQGQGYGGGGGGHFNEDDELISDGLPGVILMEILKKSKVKNMKEER